MDKIDIYYSDEGYEKAPVVFKRQVKDKNVVSLGKLRKKEWIGTFLGGLFFLTMGGSLYLLWKDPIVGWVPGYFGKSWVMVSVLFLLMGVTLIFFGIFGLLRKKNLVSIKTKNQIRKLEIMRLRELANEMKIDLVFRKSEWKIKNLKKEMIFLIEREPEKEIIKGLKKLKFI